MDSQMVDVRDRQLDLFDESVERLFLVTDAVLTLKERGFLSSCVLYKDTSTIRLNIDLPAVTFLAALKDEDVCVDVEESLDAEGVTRKPIFVHWLYNKLRTFKYRNYEKTKK